MVAVPYLTLRFSDPLVCIPRLNWDLRLRPYNLTSMVKASVESKARFAMFNIEYLVKYVGKFKCFLEDDIKIVIKDI